MSPPETLYDFIPNFFQVYMNTLLEPPSRIFHPEPCINSYFAIKRRSRFLLPLNLDIPSLRFSTLTFPKANWVTSKDSPPCIRSEKSFSPATFALNTDSPLSSRDTVVRANRSFTLTL